MDPYSILGIAPGASLDQVNETYQEKLTAISNADPNDPGVHEQSRQLEEAYRQIIESQAKALTISVAQSTYRITNDPALALVNSLDQSLEEGTRIETSPCPYCGKANPSQATICLACGKQITRPCPNCAKPILLSQVTCSRCGTLIREYDQQRLAESMLHIQQLQQERTEDRIRVEELQRKHRTRAGYGAIFYIIAGVVLIGLCVLSIIVLGALA